MTVIKDGTGTGYQVGVDESNRLQVKATTLDEERFSAGSGDSFAFSSNLVSFTAATDSAILWIKNEDSRPLVIDRARVMLGTVTGGTGDWTLRFIRNGTTGTVITNAVAAGVTNTNHGSSKEPIGDFYRGVQGDTLTDGTGAPFPIKSAGDGQLVFDLVRVLTTGASLGVRLQPPTSTTAATANVVLRGYYLNS